MQPVSFVTESLNEILRRLQQYQTEADWASAVLDGALCFCERCAVFRLQGTELRLVAERHLEQSSIPPFPLAEAKAFSTAAQFLEGNVTLRLASEVGERLSSPERMDRAHVLPIVRGKKVRAFLYVEDQEEVQASGLELVAGMASLALRDVIGDAVSITSAPPALGSPQKAEVHSVRERTPSWLQLPEPERLLHAQAQRFARKRVATISLLKPEAAQEGLKQGNLYLFLKNEVDQARESYRSQFGSHRHMPDYIHSELLRLADGEQSKLGEDYPGPMA
ncbi:MAG: hypothetical protein INR62_03290 [Rhodospirillales bacterium]|nr:hypothetical protein [Acetobacter sp.]